jgi:hypothetical protein
VIRQHLLDLPVRPIQELGPAGCFPALDAFMHSEMASWESHELGMLVHLRASAFQDPSSPRASFTPPTAVGS